MANTSNGKAPTQLYEDEHRCSDVTQDLLDRLLPGWTSFLFYFLVLFVPITLAWIMLPKVDETGSTRGGIEPQGKTINTQRPQNQAQVSEQLPQFHLDQTPQNKLQRYDQFLDRHPRTNCNAMTSFWMRFLKPK